MGTLKSVCSSCFSLISRDKYEHTHLRVPNNKHFPLSASSASLLKLQIFKIYLANFKFDDLCKPWISVDLCDCQFQSVSGLRNFMATSLRHHIMCEEMDEIINSAFETKVIFRGLL